MTVQVDGSKFPAGAGVRQCNIAVLVPCFNEESTVGKTVADFRATLPLATVYVYDNNSTDRTVDIAKAAGAIVRNESRQGKGNVVRRMFADIDADIYVLVDGDATYEAQAAPPTVLQAIEEKLDFINGARVPQKMEAYHRFGNYVLTGLVRNIFGRQFTDMLSGYKVFFSPLRQILSCDVERLRNRNRIDGARARVAHAVRLWRTSFGSVSKLSTFRDGARISRLIFDLVRNERPLQFFGLVGVVLILVAVALAIPLAETYFETGLVPRLPTTILVVGLITVGSLSCLTGLILDVVATMRSEIKRLAYLSCPPGSVGGKGGDAFC